MTTTIGSGLGSSFGTGIESSYGSLATINRWNAVESAEIKLQPKFFTGSGLRGGTLVQDTNDRFLTNADAGGSVKCYWYYNGMGQLGGLATGGLGVTPAQIASTLAYTTTFPWQSTSGQSLTIQQGIPVVSTGTIEDWITLGAKITQTALTCSVNQPLEAVFTIDGQDRFESSTAITSPTEPTGDPFFTWRDMAVKIGTFGSESAVSGCRKVSLTLKRNLATDRFNVGTVSTTQATGAGAGYTVKSEPIDNGFSALTGTLDTEYFTDAMYETYFTNQTPFSLIVSFTSTVNAGTTGTNKYSVTFAMPRCFFDTDQPTVTGPALVMPSMNFTALLDETHPAITTTIVSSDAAL